MIKEFAIDPEAITSWEKFRYVTEKFGVEHGRLISEFPRRWIRETIDLLYANKDLKEVRRASMVDRLSMLKRRHAIQNFGRNWNDGFAWRENAFCEHRRKPFHSLIVNGGCPGVSQAVLADEAEDHHFEVRREIKISRTTTALAEAVGPFMALSRWVVFVDPYFRPDELRWRRPLQAFLGSAANSGRSPRRCEFHLSKFEHPLEFFDDFNRECQRKLPGVIPRGMTLRLIRWAQIGGHGPNVGEHLHPRYILTDIGGIAIDSGLDEGEGDETSDLRLMSYELWRERCDDYLGDPPAFARADLDANGAPLAVDVTGTWDPSAASRSPRER